MSGVQPAVVAVSRDGEHHFSKVSTEQVTLVAGLGVAGDAHAGATVQHRSRVAVDPAQPDLRQVHLVHAELFAELHEQGFEVEPGQLVENITTTGIALLDLPRGTPLHLGGQAVVEVTGLRNPCAPINAFQPGLLNAVLGRDEAVAWCARLASWASSSTEGQCGEVTASRCGRPWHSTTRSNASERHRWPADSGAERAYRGRVLLGPGDALPHQPRRVLVAGTSGAGKTTLAAHLGRVLSLPHVEIDALFHGPGWTPRESFTAEVEAFSAQPRWVTEWQYSSVRRLLAERADLVVWLDLPRVVVMRQVVGRTVRRRLRRQVLWNGNVEAPLWTVLTDRLHTVRWAWSTHASSAQRVTALAAQRPELPVVRLRSRRQVRQWMQDAVPDAARAPMGG